MRNAASLKWRWDGSCKLRCTLRTASRENKKTKNERQAGSWWPNETWSSSGSQTAWTMNLRKHALPLSPLAWSWNLQVAERIWTLHILFICGLVKVILHAKRNIRGAAQVCTIGWSRHMMKTRNNQNITAAVIKYCPSEQIENKECDQGNWCIRATVQMP